MRHPTKILKLALLERGNLSSCIPVVKGETYPLIQTYQRFQLYQQLWGSLEWQGVFAPQNLTAQALGNDPTGDDPTQISKSAFTEGYPNTTVLEGYSAAQFMVEQVHKYPGQVSIYSAVRAHLESSRVQNHGSYLYVWQLTHSRAP